MQTNFQPKNHPEYFYPLYKDTDVTIYRTLVGFVNSRKIPSFKGSQSERDKFIKLLILTGKIKDYRLFRDEVLKALKTGVLDLKKLNEFGSKIDIPKGVDESWAIFIQDQRICYLLDELADHNVSFMGTDDEFFEFVLRYMLSQLLQDWRGSKMAVATERLKNKEIKLSHLNSVLSKWDFTKIFN